MSGVILSLFETPEGKKAVEGIDPKELKVKRKRVHYAVPFYTKVYSNDTDSDGTLKDDLRLWGRMKELYGEIAVRLFCFERQAEVTEKGDFRIWNTRCTKETYTYKGVDYIGQEFEVFEAEIIGTERMPIQERLKVHEEFLKLLDEGIEAEEAAKKAKEIYIKTHPCPSLAREGTKVCSLGGQVSPLVETAENTVNYNDYEVSAYENNTVDED